jgi:hypothetical protein
VCTNCCEPVNFCIFLRRTASSTERHPGEMSDDRVKWRRNDLDAVVKKMCWLSLSPFGLLPCGRAATCWYAGTALAAGVAQSIWGSAHTDLGDRYWSTDCYPADGHGQMSALSVRRADGRCRRSPGRTIVAPSPALTRYARYVALPAGHAQSHCREASRQILWCAADHSRPGITTPLPRQCRPEIRSIDGPAAQGGEWLVSYQHGAGMRDQGRSRYRTARRENSRCRTASLPAIDVT